ARHTAGEAAYRQAADGRGRVQGRGSLRGRPRDELRARRQATLLPRGRRARATEDHRPRLLHRGVGRHQHQAGVL
ncbi:MAG: hypothetical protein AVDCRST_MAG03-1542, partial [uncultured Rubrobacteraceae bacterium]